jgi:integrase
MSDRSLRKYLRGNVWWVKGKRPDTDEYIRESLATSDEALAEAKVDEIYRAARKRRILGPDAPKPEDELTFNDAVLLYEGSPRYLKAITKRIGKTLVSQITPAFIRSLAKKMMPMASTDTWQRQVVTPIRSVINNAHELGRCAPIRVKAFTKAQRVEQDRIRGKDSRPPIEPGSWPWLIAFCAAADPRDAALARFMFTKGARITQSVAMLRDRDMDLSAGKLRLPAAKGHPAQWVDIDPTLVAMIANLPSSRMWQAGNKHVFRIASRKHVYERWEAACKAAGIPYIQPHDAGRHGFGTEMIVRQGIDPVTTAKAGRWSSPTVPLNTYAHSDDFEAIAKDAMTRGEASTRTLAVQPKSTNGRKALK